jgi:hypothetical protein
MDDLVVLLAMNNRPTADAGGEAAVFQPAAGD